METTTYIKKVRQADASHQQQIIQLLAIDEQAYCDNQYQKGLAYAFDEVDGDTFGFETLIRSKSFWAYFKNEWAKREATFLQNFSKYDHDFLLSEYKFIHSTKGIKASKPVEYQQREIEALWTKVWRELSHV